MQLLHRIHQFTQCNHHFTYVQSSLTRCNHFHSIQIITNAIIALNPSIDSMQSPLTRFKSSRMQLMHRIYPLIRCNHLSLDSNHHECNYCIESINSFNAIITMHTCNYLSLDEITSHLIQIIANTNIASNASIDSIQSSQRIRDHSYKKTKNLVFLFFLF